MTDPVSTPLSIQYQSTARDLQMQERIRRSLYPGEMPELQRRLAVISVISVYLLGLMLLIGAFEITLLAAIPFAVWGLLCAWFAVFLQKRIDARFDRSSTSGAWMVRRKSMTLTTEGLELRTDDACEIIPWREVDQVVEREGQILFILDPRTHRGVPSSAFPDATDRDRFIASAETFFENRETG